MDVHINMEQAPIQVSQGLGGSGKAIWEKEGMSEQGTDLTVEMTVVVSGGAHCFILVHLDFPFLIVE